VGRVTKGRVRSAIQDNGGVVAAIARQFDVTRQTVYNWLDKYDLHSEIEHARADIHDVAEANIFNAVMKGDLDMSKFVLTHMPSRQKKKWSSRHEVETGVKLSPEALKLLDEMGIEADTVASEFEALIQSIHAERVSHE